MEDTYLILLSCQAGLHIHRMLSQELSLNWLPFLAASHAPVVARTSISAASERAVLCHTIHFLNYLEAIVASKQLH